MSLPPPQHGAARSGFAPLAEIAPVLAEVVANVGAESI
jgi:hypothetical protein